MGLGSLHDRVGPAPIAAAVSGTRIGGRKRGRPSQKAMCITMQVLTLLVEVITCHQLLMTSGSRGFR